MIQVRNNSSINPSQEEIKKLEDQEKVVELQQTWMKITGIIEQRGQWTEGIGRISVLYVPDKKIIEKLSYQPGLAIDSLAKNIFDEIISEVAPNYFELTIQFNDGKSIYLNYGSDEGWKQVATFRFSEPKFD